MKITAPVCSIATVICGFVEEPPSFNWRFTCFRLAQRRRPPSPASSG
jgi:hypothetical protein